MHRQIKISLQTKIKKGRGLVLSNCRIGAQKVEKYIYIYIIYIYNHYTFPFLGVFDIFFDNRSTFDKLFDYRIWIDANHNLLFPSDSPFPN